MELSHRVAERVRELAEHIVRRERPAERDRESPREGMGLGY
jgi:hypothetical protein